MHLFDTEKPKSIEEMRLLNSPDDEKEEDKPRERKLHEAAINGGVSTLIQLLHDHPSILNSLPPTSDTPLHVAALLGHLQLTKELLIRKPDFAGALNSTGSTALHLAAAKGYVEIVKELVLVGPDACFVMDRHGWTPVHLAAIKGRVGVLAEMARFRAEAIEVLTGDGDTCLHLCVKYNRLDALKVLVEGSKSERFVNWKDQNGNIILHLAVAKKQIEIVKYLLLHTEIDANSRNANGFTALDVLSQSPRDLRDLEIKQCLSERRVTKLTQKTPSININGDKDIARISSIITQPSPGKHRHTDWLARKRSSLIIVASLIGTVAFQAGISPPGGVWQSNYLVDDNGNPVDDPHDAGESVMAYNIPKAYGQFMIFNTIAFLASLSIILISVSGLPMKRRRWMWTQMVTMWIALTALSITYFITLIHMTPKNYKELNGVLYQVTKISVISWLSMMALVFIGNLVRVIRYFLGKYGYIQIKEEPVFYEEDDDNDEL